jgi:ferrochelatase
VTRAAGFDSHCVLLVNLGTPDAPTPHAVRRYLAEFLSDPRVVDFPRALWRPILHGVILNLRPSRLAGAYRSIWVDGENDSPLRHFTRLQAQALEKALAHESRVDWAMRYGAPSILERLRVARERGVRRLCILPLYPQYSGPTNLSIDDAIAGALKALDWSPEVAVAESFFDDPLYIAALRATASRELRRLDRAPERIVLSFHGLPRRLIERGDPYLAQCVATAERLREAMSWTAEFAPLAFQSKFGPGEWLGPATLSVLRAYARSGVRSIAVMTPGFVSDCIETLEEIAVSARDEFIGAGGERFAALPCLNNSPETIDLLAAIARRSLRRDPAQER